MGNLDIGELKQALDRNVQYVHSFVNIQGEQYNKTNRL